MAQVSFPFSSFLILQELTSFKVVARWTSTSISKGCGFEPHQEWIFFLFSFVLVAALDLLIPLLD